MAIPVSEASPAQLVEALTVLIERLDIYIACTFCVLLWEYVVTIQQEITYIWPSRWSVVKVCFFANRYITLLYAIFVMICAFSAAVMPACGTLHWVQIIAPAVIFFICNITLSHRCSALFRKPRMVFWSLALMSLAQALVQVGTWARNSPVPLPPGLVGCFSYPSTANTSYAYAHCIVPLVTNLVFLILTVFRILRHWSESGRTQLLDLFLRDGLQFFVVTTAAALANVVYMKAHITIRGVSVEGGAFNIHMLLAITSIMVSRLVLHMRAELSEHGAVRPSNPVLSDSSDRSRGSKRLGRAQQADMQSSASKSSFILPPYSMMSPRRKEHSSGRTVVAISTPDLLSEPDLEKGETAEVALHAARRHSGEAASFATLTGTPSTPVKATALSSAETDAMPEVSYSANQARVLVAAQQIARPPRSLCRNNSTVTPSRSTDGQDESGVLVTTEKVVWLDEDDE